MTQIRLMELILTLEQGGAQQQVLNKLIFLQEVGCFSIVVAFYDGSMRSQFEARGIPVIILPPKRYTILALPLFLMELGHIQNLLRELLILHHINILQTHLLSIYDFIAPRLRKMLPELQGLIWTFHNTQLGLQAYDRLRIKARGYQWLYPRFSKDVDRIIAVSPAVKSAIQHEFDFPVNKITTINNAIRVVDYQGSSQRDDLCKMLMIPPSSTILITVGRLSKQKGQAYLIDALKQVLARQSDVYLCLVGEGEDLIALHAQVTDLGIGDNVRFLGLRLDIPDLLSSCDIFILPSLWEGLSLAMLEAMASKIPIVATTIAGIKQVLTDGITGRLVPPRDSSALALAIEDIITDPIQGQSFADHAYQLVQAEYDISRLGTDYLNLYQQLIRHPNWSNP